MKIYKAKELIGHGRKIGIEHHIQNRIEQIHCHDFIEIVYARSGHAAQRLDDACYEVERGDMIFINFGSRHAFETHGDFEYYNICFLPEVIGSSIITRENAVALLSLTAFDDMRKEKNGGKLSFTGNERQDVEYLLSMMLREAEHPLPASAQILENCLGILISKMLRHTLIGKSNLPEENLWDLLTNYIDAHLDAPLTLSALAEKCFYHPSYFSRIFKQRFGMSPSDYVRTRRIEQAMTLLSETQLSVDEIMQQTGYHDKSTFYHAFTRQVHLTPLEYRAQQQVK